LLSDRIFGYAISKAAQHISSKNKSPVYFHEFGYSGNYSILAFGDPKSYSRGSSKSHNLDIILFYLYMSHKINKSF